MALPRLHNTLACGGVNHTNTGSFFSSSIPEKVSSYEKAFFSTGLLACEVLALSIAVFVGKTVTYEGSRLDAAVESSDL